MILQPWEMSLHHGHIFHGSLSNQSGDRPYAYLVSGLDNIGRFRLLSHPDEIMSEKDVRMAIENIRVGEKFFYENANIRERH